MRADRRIDTVAIGDPRMVAAAPVHRGSEVFDVVLQPLSDTGTTNMVVWLGDVTTIWDLEIGPGRRTADVVFLVTQARAAQPAAPPSPSTTTSHTPPNATTTVSATAVPRNPTAPTTASAPGQSAPPPAQAAAPSPGPTIELRQTVGPVTAVLRAFRMHSGILLRYEITNGSETDLVIKPAAILVRADGRAVAYGMARDSVDRGRPDIVPRGATETGVIDIATPSARQIEVALSLLPVPPAPTPAAPNGQAAPAPPAAHAGTASSAPVPIVLQATFSGLDRLPVTPAP